MTVKINSTTVRMKNWSKSERLEVSLAVTVTIQVRNDENSQVSEAMEWHNTAFSIVTDAQPPGQLSVKTRGIISYLKNINKFCIF